VTGKEIRLKRLFKNTGKILIVPMDHGITIGPIEGLRNMSEIVKSVNSGGADAVVVHKGLVGQITDSLSADGCQLIVHLSGSTSLAPDPNKKEMVASVEHAIRIGATAVSVHVNLGSTFESQMLRDLGKTAEECEKWGIPLLAMMYVRDGSKESEYNSSKIMHAARVAEELGADIIKVNYSGSPESFVEVTSAIAKPVVIAGGPKMSSTSELLTMIVDAVSAGAKGVAIGRNVFQYPRSEHLVSVIRQILDKNIPREKVAELIKSKENT
jgi:predicted phospho-2-dehydro-3-deoxyheptonate aldolase